MRTSDSTWLSRLRLLDDLPLSGRGADLFELEPHVRLLAEAILHCAGPLVVHVDGTWGRGKTSFCRLVEEELTRSERADERGRAPVSCSRYVASDDQGSAASSLLYAIAKAVAGPNDPEEAARIVRQWGADEELSAMRVDGFATWLGHELGRSNWTPATTTIEIPLGTGRVLKREWIANRRRSAVVFVDDLDRCPGERVVEILDAIRSYVACPGLVFVIAADRRLVAQAFAQIVAREADLRHVDAAEAMEKYIHRRVELPSFRGFRGTGLAYRLRALQSQLVAARSPYLLSIPTAEFEDGVGFQLARRFGASLTPRRLKRVLNDFAIDMAGFVDEAGLGLDFEDEDRWRELWVAQEELEPLYARGPGRPGRGELRRFFVGRLLVRVAEHMWPSLFARLDARDDEFVRRTDRLLALARTHAQWRTPAARDMRDELLRGLDPVETTPLHVRRELCEFMAAVFEAAGEASRWQGAAPEEALALGFANNVVEAAEGEAAPFVETLQQQAIVPQQALVSLGDETYLAPKGLSSLSKRRSDVAEEVDDDEDDEDDEVAFADEAEALDDEPASDPLGAVERDLARLEADMETMSLAEQRARLADVLFGLELAILKTSDHARIQRLVEHVLQLFDKDQLAAQVRSLWSLARAAADCGFDDLARHLYYNVWPLTIRGNSLELVEQLELSVEILNFLVDRENIGDTSVVLANSIVDAWTLNERFEGGADLDKHELWMLAAKFRGLCADDDIPWTDRLADYIESLGAAYRAQAGRENARRYVLLLRAAGRDDPSLDELLGPRATLIHAERGDPEIIEALADILVRRGQPEAYRQAITLYLRLRGTERWTPEVLHNLATAENTLDGADDSAGAHWLEAYRRAPSNTVIRRSFRRFLLSRKYAAEAQMVSRGDPLPDAFAPFEDQTLRATQETHA